MDHLGKPGLPWASPRKGGDHLELQRDSLSPRTVRKSRAYPSLLEAMLLRDPREPEVPGDLGHQSTVVPEFYGSLCLACSLCGDMWNLCHILWSCATVMLSEAPPPCLISHTLSHLFLRSEKILGIWAEIYLNVSSLEGCPYAWPLNCWSKGFSLDPPLCLSPE